MDFMLSLHSFNPPPILVDLGIELFSHYCMVWACCRPPLGLDLVIYKDAPLVTDKKVKHELPL